MARLVISTLPAPFLSDDHTVIEAETKDEMRTKVVAYMSENYGDRWSGLDGDQKDRVKKAIRAAVQR